MGKKTKPPEVQNNSNQASQVSLNDGSDEAKLQHLKGLFDKGLIDEAEYRNKKKDILNSLSP